MNRDKYRTQMKLLCTFLHERFVHVYTIALTVMVQTSNTDHD